MISNCKSIGYNFGGLENRVLMASRRVPVSHLRVLRSRLQVPVASRQVLMRYKLTLNAGVGGAGCAESQGHAGA